MRTNRGMQLPWPWVDCRQTNSGIINRKKTEAVNIIYRAKFGLTCSWIRKNQGSAADKADQTLIEWELNKQGLREVTFRKELKNRLGRRSQTYMTFDATFNSVSRDSFCFQFARINVALSD